MMLLRATTPDRSKGMIWSKVAGGALIGLGFVVFGYGMQRVSTPRPSPVVIPGISQTTANQSTWSKAAPIIVGLAMMGQGIRKMNE
jgi:hypothetical protein